MILDCPKPARKLPHSTWHDTHSPATAAPSTAITWSLEAGTVQLFIVGPGPDAWLACSRPNYQPRSTPGTPREREIARQAVILLNQTHRNDKDAGIPQIQAALRLAAKQIRAKASLTTSTEPLTETEHAPSADAYGRVHRPDCSRRATAVDSARVLKLVTLITRHAGILPADLVGGDNSRPLSRIRHLAIGTVREVFPAMVNYQLAEIFHCDPGHIRRARDSHAARLITDPAYQKLHAAILAEFNKSPE